MKKLLFILLSLILISAVAVDMKFSDFALRGTLPGNGWTAGYIDSSNGLKYNVRYPNSVLQGRLIPGSGIVLTGNVISAPGGGGGTSGPVDTTSGAGGINRQNFIAFFQKNAAPVDYQFDRVSFDTLTGGGLDLWGHNRYPSFSTPITNLSITLSGTSSYLSGVIILTTGGSTATIGAKSVFAVLNFVPNWPLLPGSVTYSVEGDDSDTYFGANRVYTKTISSNSLSIALGAGATLPINKVFYIHYKMNPGSNASGQ